MIIALEYLRREQGLSPPDLGNYVNERAIPTKPEELTVVFSTGFSKQIYFSRL